MSIYLEEYDVSVFKFNPDLDEENKMVKDKTQYWHGMQETRHTIGTACKRRDTILGRYARDKTILGRHARDKQGDDLDEKGEEWKKLMEKMGVGVNSVEPWKMEQVACRLT